MFLDSRSQDDKTSSSPLINLQVQYSPIILIVLNQLIVKFIWKRKYSRITKNIFKKTMRKKQLYVKHTTKVYYDVHAGTDKYINGSE